LIQDPFTQFQFLISEEKFPSSSINQIAALKPNFTMSFQKPDGPAPAPVPISTFCDDCRKNHLGGLDICPKRKTTQDLNAFLDEIKTTTEPRADIKTEQTPSSAILPNLVQEKAEKKITLKHLPCDRFAV